LLVCWFGAFPCFAIASLRVVTTIAPLTDIVGQVGGRAIHLHGLVPQGVNSHTFQPAPRDVRYLAEADLIVMNGLHLEIPIEKLARSSSTSDVVILKLGDETINKTEWIFDLSFPKTQGYPNPHLWLNVAYVMTYTTLIRDQLCALDPPNTAVFHQNATRYLARLSQLDQCIATAVATIPAPHRTLLTYHDSWPYFARRYGMTILGAIQPANFFEPSPLEIARIIDHIRQAHIPTIFGSEVFPSKVLNKIAAETGVRYVTTLRDDTLPGNSRDGKHNYIGMMLENVSMIVETLGGEPHAFASCASTLLREIE
jgi:ABC-type Zn uptake system ZnuABC Zn-binding protein ZnuA